MDHPHLLDLTIDDLENGKLQITEIWEVETPAFPFHVLLKNMETMTETKITIDEITQKINVSGKDTATVKFALSCLTKLHTAWTLFKRYDNPHHIFPPKGYDQLQMISFKAHSAAVTIQSLATEIERTGLSTMGVLIPLKPVSRKHTVKVTPSHLSSSSRYWQAYEFQGFSNIEPSRVNPTSLRSPVSNDVGLVVLIDTSPLTAPEKSDGIKKWIDKGTQPETQAPSFIESFDIEASKSVSTEKPAEKPKNIHGLLKRRAARPRCYQTMAQKTAPGTPAAQRQVTLDDIWRDAFANLKLQPKDTPASEDPSVPSSNLNADANASVPSVNLSADANASIPPANSSDSSAEPSASRAEEYGDLPQKEVTEVTKPQVKVNRRRDAHEIQEIFDGMQPILEAATCFPGALELELHIELVVVSSLPSMSIDEWKELFQPEATTRPHSSFWLWNKLTASGPDVDSVVDLKWSQKKGKRMFEDEPTDRAVVYEFHCRMKDGFDFVITLDEKGQPTFHEPDSAISSSTVHVPHRTWDLNLVLKGSMNLLRRLEDENLKAAIDNFVKTIKLEPGSNLYLYCIQPMDETFIVDKILMKRWTRHKHLPADRQENSNLMLKILEVQQFVMISYSLNHRAIRARIPLLDREEWASRQWLWFEVSIASDEIQKLLDSNRDLAPGEQTQKWKPVDLLGDEIELKDIPVESNAVAKAIGNSGLGYMFRLGKSILDRMTIGES